MALALDPAQRGVLHWLGHFYLRQGQPKRALVLLMLAARDAPTSDPGLLPAVALALVENGLADRAAEVMGWIAASPSGEEPAALLLAARVALLAGRDAEARAAFERFAAARARARTVQEGTEAP